MYTYFKNLYDFWLLARWLVCLFAQFHGNCLQIKRNEQKNRAKRFYATANEQKSTDRCQSIYIIINILKQHFELFKIRRNDSLPPGAHLSHDIIVINIHLIARWWYSFCNKNLHGARTHTCIHKTVFNNMFVHADAFMWLLYDCFEIAINGIRFTATQRIVISPVL